MKNFVTNGKTIEVVLAADLASGAPLTVGDLVGVAAGAYKNGDTAVLELEGVYDLPKTNPQVIAIGVIVYWDATNSLVTTTASGNKKIGHAWEAAISAATVVRVKLSR